MEPESLHNKSPYIEAFEFEVFDVWKSRQLLTANRNVALGTCVLYVVLIHVGQMWMKNRPAFSLRPLLVIWNSSLAIFSIVGFARTCPELWYTLLYQKNGLYLSTCTHDILNYSTAFWAYVFTLSKLVELGDTVFIVLRKQKLIFLHWYHHISVLMMTWIYYETFEPAFRWFGTMNYFIHGCMYSYYALKSMKVPVPRSWAMVLTMLQILQMVVGLFIGVYTYNLKSSGVPCYRTMDNIIMGLSIYFSYFLLFLHYFFKAYFGKSKKKED